MLACSCRLLRTTRSDVWSLGLDLLPWGERRKGHSGLSGQCDRGTEPWKGALRNEGVSRKVTVGQPGNMGHLWIMEDLECHAMVSGAHSEDKGKPLRFSRRDDVTQPVSYEAGSAGV